MSGSDLDRVLQDAAALARPDDEVADAIRRGGIDERRQNLLRGDVPLTRAERDRLIDDAGIHRTAALDAVGAWCAAATSFGAQRPATLILAGPEGSGRTFAAAWAIARGSGRYRDADDLTFGYRRAQSARATSGERAEVAKLRRARVLAIGRVGSEEDRDTMRDALSGVIDRRDAHGQLTILITELRPWELFDHASASAVYGSRTNERLRHPATRVVDLHGAAG